MQRFNRPTPLLMTMADLFFRRGRYRDAEETYREVLQRTKGNASAMNNLAMLLAQQGIKLDEVLNLANQAIDIFGPAGMLLDSRASVYLAMGDANKALADMRMRRPKANRPSGSSTRRRPTSAGRPAE